LNLDQVDELELGWAKKHVNPNDTNTTNFIEKYGVNWSIELDAISTNTIQCYLFAALSYYLDLTILDRVKEKNREMVNKWKKEHGLED
jgi:hypothetical protein